MLLKPLPLSGLIQCRFGPIARSEKLALEKRLLALYGLIVELLDRARVIYVAAFAKHVAGNNLFFFSLIFSYVVPTFAHRAPPW